MVPSRSGFVWVLIILEIYQPSNKVFFKFYFIRVYCFNCCAFGSPEKIYLSSEKVLENCFRKRTQTLSIMSNRHEWNNIFFQI